MTGTDLHIDERLRKLLPPLTPEERQQLKENIAKLTALQRHLTIAQEIINQTSPHVIHSACQGAGCDECGAKGYLAAGEISHLNKPTKTD